MTVTERVAYLKGLFEGLGIDAEEKEGKLLKGMLETMEALAASVVELEQQNAALLDELDEMYSEIDALDEKMHDDSEEDEELDFDPDQDLYQVICPTCEENIFIDEGTLAEGSIQCPACGEDLEFDLSELETELEQDEPVLEPEE